MCCVYRPKWNGKKEGYYSASESGVVSAVRKSARNTSYKCTTTIEYSIRANYS
jgi:hypothetical protein